jgi:Ca2+/Na+ antiporter
MKQKKNNKEISFSTFLIFGIVLFGIIKFWQIALCVFIVTLALFIVIMIYRPELRAKVQAKIKQLKDKIL